MADMNFCKICGKPLCAEKSEDILTVNVKCNFCGKTKKVIICKSCAVFLRGDCINE